MKKNMVKKLKRGLAFAMAAVMVFTMGTVLPSSAETVEAASVHINSLSANQTVTYTPGREKYGAPIYIGGCTKKSQIKKLKSSNPSVAKVSAEHGFINVSYGKKAGKAKITCTVKGKKLSTYFTVKKYSNPLSTFKIGSKSFLSKYKKDNNYQYTLSFKSKTLKLKAKKGWKIRTVYINNGGNIYNTSTSRWYEVNKTSFSKKITLKNNPSTRIQVSLYNNKMNANETITLKWKSTK